MESNMSNIPESQTEVHCLRGAPEPGQLVEVRRRQWVVAEVDVSKLGEIQQRLVTLTSLEDDALGEELKVIWDIEPGAQVIERAGLPAITGQDDSKTLDAFLDAVRWGAATNADRGFLQAPFRSGVSIEDFQLDPLVRAIDMARVNLLIADDVGLGKTIEAGLVIQELLIRHRARTVLIIVPASLQEKWRVEMLEKFGLDFCVVDTDYIKHMRRERGIHANPWTSHPRLIASMDWVKSGEGLRAMRDVLPIMPGLHRKFDLLVVDEAHNIAPAAGAHYALESQRTKFVRLISPHFQHKLFLTATPHNGYTESFTSLLELLDDQRFARNILPDDKQLSQVMIRRLKSDLVDAEGKLLYAQRKLQALEVQYTPEERNVHQKLNDFCASRESSSRSIGTSFVNQLLKKRLFSSPSAFATTLEKHIATLSEGGRRKPKDVMTERILRKAILRAEEDYANDHSVEAAQTEAVEEASRLAEPLSDEQQRMVAELRDWAQRAKNQPDSKAKAILDWLDTHLKPGGQWNERRVILFTEYRTTHQWMEAILVSHGYGGDRLGLLHGGLSQDDRGPIKAAFQASPKDSPIRILLATDAASEGIDLQKHCNYLIHLEIPYNPNVMEQRNGRIDRHGQRAKEVIIWHPVDGGEAGQVTIGGHGDDILRSLRKLESMRADMGSVNPVIAPQMSGLIEGTLKEIDTRIAEAKIAKIEKSKIFVRAGRAIETRVAALHKRLLETQDQFHLTPEHILMAVKTALLLEGQPALIQADLTGAPSGSIFRLPPMSGSWARCAEGLEDPYLKGIIRPITFDHSVAKGRDDVVLVHLNHRLVQMCLRLLRAEVWAQDDVKKLHRVAVRSLPASHIDGPAVVVVSRLVITGGNHHRLHEELIVSGGYLRDQSFRREEGVSRLQEWLDGAQPFFASDELFDSLRVRFDRFNSGVLQSIDARSKDRLKFLTNTLQTRKRQEKEDIVAVLDELESSIRIELDKDQQPEQFSLFSDDEHIQLRRDNAALEARLKRIPVERVQEVEAIETRYDNLADRTFPVAVIFLVPETSSKGGAV
jgi:superfamily II DNA or RNA helicase